MSSMAPYLVEFYQKSSLLAAKIHQTQQQRLELESKARSLNNVDRRLQNREQLDQIETYFSRLNREAQHAEQRHLKILNDLSQAERSLDQIRIDAERLIRLKVDYGNYLETTQKAMPTIGYINPASAYDFDRSNVVRKENFDEPSSSEHTSTSLSRSKRPGSLRVDLKLSGLDFLLKYIENELVDMIDRKRLYHDDSPTLSQRQTILNIAEQQQTHLLKDLDPKIVSMFVFDQLPSIIRRTTTHQCLFTDEILSANIKDLNKNSIGQMLPENDRPLWFRLIEHLIQLQKYHIMTAEALGSKFATIFLANQISYKQDKAKELLKHLVEQAVATVRSSPSSNDESSMVPDRRPIPLDVNRPMASSWLDQFKANKIDKVDDVSSTSPTMTTEKKANAFKSNSSDDDSDFFD